MSSPACLSARCDVKKGHPVDGKSSRGTMQCMLCHEGLVVRSAHECVENMVMHHFTAHSDASLYT